MKAPLEKAIARADCVDRHVYYIKSRNLNCGVFREATGGFIGIREKFDSLYLFEEYHWETSNTFGTVQPLIDIGVLPEGIELLETVDGGCTGCGNPITYDNDVKARMTAAGLTLTDDAYEWPWKHDNPEDEIACAEENPGGSRRRYQPLFDYLTPINAGIAAEERTSRAFWESWIEENYVSKQEAAKKKPRSGSI
jgi:hypothetical protein